MKVNVEKLLSWKTAKIAAATVVLATTVPFYIYYKTTQNTFEATISYQKPGNGTDAKNIVGLSDDPYNWGEVRNDDEPLILKFSSGRLAGRLSPGKKCQITTYGLRSGFFSWRPNVIAVGECK